MATGSTDTERKENTAEKQPSTPQKAKKREPMDADKDDEKPQNEPETSSHSQTSVPILPLQQGPAASSQGPASANSGDEDSEYSDESSAQCSIQISTV